MVWYERPARKRKRDPRTNDNQRMQTDSLNPQIFRQYDIRGRVGEDLNPRVLEALGRAFGSLIAEAPERPGRKVVTVGRDVRETSAEFAAAFARGLNAAGVDAIEVGMVPTPVLYFSIFHWDA